MRASILSSTTEYIDFKTQKGFIYDGLENFNNRKRDANFYIIRSGKELLTVELFTFPKHSEMFFRTCKYKKKDLGVLISRRVNPGVVIQHVEFSD